MKNLLQDYLLWLCVAVVVTLLLATTAGLCLAALYLYLIGLFAPEFAALITAGATLFLAGLIALCAWLACRRGCAQKSRKSSEQAEQGEDVLNSVLASLVTDWIAANAKKATFAGLLAGVATGASPELRHLLMRALRGSGSSGK